MSLDPRNPVFSTVILFRDGQGLVGWQVWHPPEQAYAKALGAVDSVLVQQWGSPPNATQEALSTTYGRRGWPSPGDRQGARK